MKDPQCPSRKQPQGLKTSYQALLLKFPTSTKLGTQSLTCGSLGNILDRDHGEG